MRFWDDDRAQSMQIGAILLFGFLIIAMATYQAQVVPASNSATEFEHSQEVLGQFIDLRSAVLSAASTGNTESTSLALGTRYPQRTFFVNPPPPTGSISTSDPQTLRIDNASVVADGNTGEFWDNRNLTFETRSIRYAPQYNEYDDPPDLVYDHSLVAAEFDDAVLTRTGQTTVENGEIALTLIDGNLSESGVGTRGIDLEVLSQNARRVTLNATGNDSIVLELPTTVEGGDNRAALAAEWESEIEGDANVTAMDGESALRVEFTDDNVSLRLAQVGVGTGTTVTNGSNGYITSVSSTDVEAGDGFTVEVRDQFNNPVADATVAANHTNLSSQQTGADGRATFTLEANDSGNSETVNLSINGGSETWETINVTVSKQQGGGGTGNNADSLTIVDGSTPSSEQSTLTFDIENTGSNNLTITQFNVTTPGKQNSAVTTVDSLNRNSKREVEITGGGTNGFANIDPGIYATNGTTYGLGTNAVVNGGGTATVTMRDTNNGNILLKYDTTTEGNADIVVTLILSDGSTHEVYLRVTNVNS